VLPVTPKRAPVSTSAYLKACSRAHQSILNQNATFRAFGKTRRFVFMSDSFRTNFAELVDIIDHCADSWRIITEDELVRIKQTARGARASELYALVCGTEFDPSSRAASLAGVKYVLTEFLARHKLIVIPQPL